MSDSKLFSRLLAELSDQPPISSVSTIEFADFEPWGSAGYPVKFPCASLTEQEVSAALVIEYADKPVKVRVGDYANPTIYREERGEKYLTIDEFLQNIRAADGRYLANASGSFGLLRKLAGPTLGTLGGEEQFELPAVWMGGPGAITPLHRDSTDNFAFHFSGAKDWILFPIRDTLYLDMQPVRYRPGAEFYVSSHDLRSPSVLEHLKRVGAHPIRCRVSAGECLYVPTGWAHFVHTVEVTLMINVWQKELDPARVLRKHGMQKANFLEVKNGE